ncbi:MAG: permease-like cell division protein FtsX [Oscillospiraceae bacterium]|nr:permease-like cell division protein FtsX [Oscillospiraceae bacterium]
MGGGGGRVYLTRMGLRNVYTNRTMSTASVLVLVSCLMLIGLVTLLAVNFNLMFAEFSSRNVVMAYLVPGLEQEQVDSLRARIEALPSVSGCEYISSQEAYDMVMKRNESDFKLLQDVDPSFMPDGFEVSPVSQSQLESTVEQLQQLDPAIDTVRHFQGVAAQLSALEKAFAILGAAVIGILLLVSVFIISSTVQATMYSRQQEIKVMKSVGAAPAFIRWPFLVEGVVLGLAGSAAALLVVFLVYLGIDKALQPALDTLLGGFRLAPFRDQLKLLLPGFFVVGVLTGGVGSMVSITRYLKEKVYEDSEPEA